MANAPKIWGSRTDLSAGSHNIVILDIPKKRTFTPEETGDEVQRRGLPQRGAIRNHFYSLQKKGHVVKVPGGWQRISDSAV